jgi:hypothetical protein
MRLLISDAAAAAGKAEGQRLIAAKEERLREQVQASEEFASWRKLASHVEMLGGELNAIEGSLVKVRRDMSDLLKSGDGKQRAKRFPELVAREVSMAHTISCIRDALPPLRRERDALAIQLRLRARELCDAVRVSIQVEADGEGWRGELSGLIDSIGACLVPLLAGTILRGSVVNVPDAMAERITTDLVGHAVTVPLPPDDLPVAVPGNPWNASSAFVPVLGFVPPATLQPAKKRDELPSEEGPIRISEGKTL